MHDFGSAAIDSAFLPFFARCQRSLARAAKEGQTSISVWG
jgi:hypothetical protein